MKGFVYIKMRFMKKCLRFMGKMFGLSLITGLVVSRVEKKKSWSECHKPYGLYEKYMKRPLDFGLSLWAIIFLWPIMVIIGVIVRQKMGSPVLFEQKRPGLDGDVFMMRKFRTMTSQRGNNGELLPDEERLTSFGKYLRSSSFDELPELFNIISGDMSIIGPRPLLVEYLGLYNDRQRHRHDIKPGLTGLAQINGRNELDWEERFEDDLRYVEKITFFGDMKILWKTMAVVFMKKGISSKTSETMEAFTGNKRHE